MISYIKGIVLHKTAHSIVVFHEYIGYEVFLPVNHLARYAVQQEVELYTYLHVREDAMQLYGFESWEEKEFYLLLLNVSGVGPKGALAIIGQSSLVGIHQAIANENLAFLTKVPGVGKKTAQRLILELKDKLPKGNIFGEGTMAAPQEQFVLNEQNDVRSDIVAVLLSLGYHDSEIRQVVPQLMLEENQSEQEIIKKALQLLAKI